eukprot:TRINITY_DN22255_c0_g1_i1.p1 TRINITY_DN22255_c0_g1~~TRINITY_DN22255_c0_g1_i1.p1  ORF type:complete len:539 (+),score=99.54 TRINITY_DN22255_c0_g1_i1:195-1811(+)
MAEAEAILHLEYTRRDARMSLDSAVLSGDIAKLEQAIELGKEARLGTGELADADAKLHLEYDRRDARASLSSAKASADIVELERAIQLGMEAKLDVDELAEAEHILRLERCRRDARMSICAAMLAADIDELRQAIKMGVEAGLRADELAQAEAMLSLECLRIDARVSLSAATHSAEIVGLEKAIQLGKEAQLDANELVEAENMLTLEYSRRDARVSLTNAMKSAEIVELEQAIRMCKEALLDASDLTQAEALLAYQLHDHQKELAKQTLKQLGVKIPGKKHKRDRSPSRQKSAKSRRQDSRVSGDRNRSQSLGSLGRVNFLMKRKATAQDPKDRPTLPRRRRSQQLPAREQAPSTPSVLRQPRSPVPSLGSVTTPIGCAPMSPGSEDMQDPTSEFCKAMSWVQWKGARALFVDLKKVTSEKVFTMGMNAGWKVCRKFDRKFVENNEEWVCDPDCTDQVPVESSMLRVPTENLVRVPQGADVIVGVCGANKKKRPPALGLLLAIAAGTIMEEELPDMASTLRHDGYPWLVAEAKRLASH